ncbi:MAG: insulinase family protein [Bacilli bacterium]|nr:insulinase family protein [Bacilli bacterium]
MKKKTFEKVDENIYYEKLSNGLEVYLYPTNKTRNFYISISVKYGANVTQYKKGNKIVNVIPGSAHFLEHKVMALSENKEISERINSLGSLANAWTNYHGTNYNIFGSINLIENLKLLLDIFYNTNINEKCVEEEKGIIGEEIDMYKDQINSYMFDQLYKNLFNNSYVKNTVVGERNDIEGITAKRLNEIYNDFYVPNNTFIIVTGNFDPNDVMNVIKDYINRINIKPKKIPHRMKNKELEKVNISYEEIKKDMEDVRVKYAIKMKKNIFNIKSNSLLRRYINLILFNNFSASGALFEKYKNENIVVSIGYNVNIIDDYVVIAISALCNDGDIFIDRISKDIKKLTFSKNEFERKKKLLLKSYIMDFDNIEDVEYNICESILMENKIDYNEYSSILNMDYDKAIDILKQFNFDNVSVIRTIK